MIKVYANLVLKGLKTLEEVPAKFRLAVETLVMEARENEDN